MRPSKRDAAVAKKTKIESPTQRILPAAQAEREMPSTGKTKSARTVPANLADLPPVRKSPSPKEANPHVPTLPAITQPPTTFWQAVETPSTPALGRGCGTA
jgi:hypothetical protein